MKSKSMLLVAVLLFPACMAVTGQVFGASVADLAGTWHINSLATGPDAPFWGRATITVASDGTFSGSESGSDGTSANITGAFSLSSGGFSMTGTTITSPVLCQLDEGDTVLACTQTGSDSSSYLIVAVKQGSSYITSDMAATWEANCLDGGPSTPSWWRLGDDTVGDNGNFTTSYSDSNGGAATLTGQLALASNGEATCVAGDCPDPNFTSYMDAGKTVIVGSDGASAETPDASLTVTTKYAPWYSMDDLAGVWQLNALASGQSAPWWERGTMTINPDGTWSIPLVDNGGSPYLKTGTFEISSGGLVTCTRGCNNSIFRIVMNAGKTVMVATATWSDSSGTEIKIFTKSSGGLWRNAQYAGNGWEWLDPFGFFSTNTSNIWIYHQTLGWLYPVGTTTDNIWFYDPQWDNGKGGWWWTNGSNFPWIYSSTDGAWFYYDAAASTPGARWFWNSSTGWGEH